MAGCRPPRRARPSTVVRSGRALRAGAHPAFELGPHRLYDLGLLSGQVSLFPGVFDQVIQTVAGAVIAAQDLVPVADESQMLAIRVHLVTWTDSLGRLETDGMAALGRPPFEQRH